MYYKDIKKKNEEILAARGTADSNAQELRPTMRNAVNKNKKENTLMLLFVIVILIAVLLAMFVFVGAYIKGEIDNNKITDAGSYQVEYALKGFMGV